MSDSLGLSIVLYALTVAAVCVGVAVIGIPRPQPVTGSLVVLEVVALGQAGLDALSLLSGHHGPQVATNLGYALTSVAILPVVAIAVRLDDRRWGTASAGVGCLLLAVVSLRLHTTLHDPRA